MDRRVIVGVTEGCEFFKEQGVAVGVGAIVVMGVGVCGGGGGVGVGGGGGGRVETRADVFHLTVEKVDECCPAILEAEFEEELFVAFDDEDETVMAEAEGFRDFGGEDVAYRQHQLNTSERLLD